MLHTLIRARQAALQVIQEQTGKTRQGEQQRITIQQHQITIQRHKITIKRQQITI
jgi:uncharacterized surface protein with fasciclin (FAS1) repeats